MPGSKKSEASLRSTQPAWGLGQHLGLTLQYDFCGHAWPQQLLVSQQQHEDRRNSETRIPIEVVIFFFVIIMKPIVHFQLS